VVSTALHGTEQTGRERQRVFPLYDPPGSLRGELLLHWAVEDNSAYTRKAEWVAMVNGGPILLNIRYVFVLWVQLTVRLPAEERQPVVVSQITVEFLRG
jgi:hypothetical protein